MYIKIKKSHSIRPKPPTKRNKSRKSPITWLSFGYGPMCARIRCNLIDKSAKSYIWIRDKSSVKRRPRALRFLPPSRPVLSCSHPGRPLSPFFVIGWRRMFKLYALKFAHPVFSQLHKLKSIRLAKKLHPKLTTLRDTITVNKTPWSPSTLHRKTTIHSTEHRPKYYVDPRTKRPKCTAKFELHSATIQAPVTYLGRGLRRVETTLLRSIRRSPIWKKMTRRGNFRARITLYHGRLTRGSYIPNHNFQRNPKAGSFTVRLRSKASIKRISSFFDSEGGYRLQAPQFKDITKQELRTNAMVPKMVRILVSVQLSQPSTASLSPGSLICTEDFLHFINSPHILVGEPLSSAIQRIGPSLIPMVSLWVFYLHYHQILGITPIFSKKKPAK